MRAAFACLLVVTAVAGCRSAAAPYELRLPGAGPDHELVFVEPGPGMAHGFWIGRFEVTQAQFAAFVAATGYDGSEAASSKSTEPFLADWRDGQPPAGQERHPVCQINWHHATAFCRWLSQRTGRTVRLPTDAEWLWAARGDSQRTYPWGNDWEPTRCNWGESGSVDGYKASAPVGSYPTGANPAGLHDLAGNIWEWSRDRHLLGGPWCMGPDKVRLDFVAREDAMRADDKFGLRIVVEP